MPYLNDKLKDSISSLTLHAKIFKSPRRISINFLIFSHNESVKQNIIFVGVI